MIQRGQAAKISCGWSGFSGATEVTARLCSGSEPRRRGLEALKCVELKNLCCQSLSKLKIELRKAKERLSHKKHGILVCLSQPVFEV